MMEKNRTIKLLVGLGIVAALMTISVVSAQVPPPENDVIVDVTPESQTGKLGDTLTYDVSLTNNGTVDDIIVVDSITGIPANWTVELKDAGVPTLPYQTPLLASQTSYFLTLDVHIPANATAGTTAMSINIHSLANPDVTDTDTFNVKTVVEAAAPVATVPVLTPVGLIVLVGLLCVVVIAAIAIKQKSKP